MDQETLPRETKFGDNQRDLTLSALDKALAMPEVQCFFAVACGYFLEFWEAHIHDQVSQAAGNLYVYLHLEASLIEMIALKAPQVMHAFGPRLKDWLPVMCFAWAGITPPPHLDSPQKLKIYRFLPDNPMILRSDGSVENFAKATKAHRLQLEDYFQSLEPSNRGGRPKGTGHHTEALILAAIDRLRANCELVTQPSVAEELGVYDAAGLRAILRGLSLNWGELVSYSPC